MTALARALLGILVGMLVVGALHPRTSAILRTAFAPIGSSPRWSNEPLRTETVRELPTPDVELQAAFWPLVYAERDFFRSKPTEDRKSRLEALLTVATHWARRDPENAFWRQIRSIVALEMGDPSAAKSAWIEASRCQRWSDLQSPRLTILADRLGREQGGLAWIDAAAYFERSDALSDAIAFHAVRLNTYATPEEQSDILLATIENGDLMRTNAQSVRTGRIAVEMIEGTTQPMNLSRTSVRRLITARYDFIDKVREQYGQATAVSVEESFRETDAWTALVDSPSDASLPVRLAVDSLLETRIVPTCFVAALCGALAMGLFSWDRFREWILRHARRPPMLIGIGLATIALGYLLETWLLSLLLLGTVALQWIPTSRPRPTDRLRDELVLPTLGLGVALAVMAVLYGLMVSSSSGWSIIDDFALIPLGPSTTSLLDPRTLWTLLWIPLAMPLVLGRIASWISREPAHLWIFGLCRETGRQLILLGCVIVILAIPAVSVRDDDRRDVLTKLRQNESRYYFNATR